MVLTPEEMLLLFGNEAIDLSKSKPVGDDSQGSGHMSPSGSANGMQLRRRLVSFSLEVNPFLEITKMIMISSVLIMEMESEL